MARPVTAMVKVFAYGSNLCVERLRARTPSATVVATGTVTGHALRWNKRCPDGSAKANAFETGNPDDVVWGVVYELTPHDKILLDGFEGLGHDYFEKVVPVLTRDDVMLEAVIYVANPELVADEPLKPFAWYKGFVTCGARQHGLPDEYCSVLEEIEAREDENAERHARESAVLEAAVRRLRGRT